VRSLTIAMLDIVTNFKTVLCKKEKNEEKKRIQEKNMRK